MAVKVYTLSNGLRVVLYPESYRSAYMTLITRAGPRFERPEEIGLSHFFEHFVVRDQISTTRWNRSAKGSPTPKPTPKM